MDQGVLSTYFEKERGQIGLLDELLVLQIRGAGLRVVLGIAYFIADAAKEIQILKDRLDRLQKVIDEQSQGGANAPDEGCHADSNAPSLTPNSRATVRRISAIVGSVVIRAP